MHIYPFGCMAWATKPRSFISKTNLDSRAWEGINLGCSELSPAGYDVWVPKGVARENRIRQVKTTSMKKASKPHPVLIQSVK